MPPKSHSECHVYEVRFSPIEDAGRERRNLEKDYSRWAASLCASLPTGEAVPGRAFESRVIEVYRLCYEQAPRGEQENVLNDFVAHFPHLAFEAEWLCKLVRRYATCPDVDGGQKRKGVFKAIADGFRRVSDPKWRGRADALWVRSGGVFLANQFRLVQVMPELEEWNRALDRTHADAADPKWIAEIACRAKAKAAELGKRYPRLESHQAHIAELLTQPELYDASVLIAATIFGVPVHELEHTGRTVKSSTKS